MHQYSETSVREKALIREASKRSGSCIEVRLKALGIPLQWQDRDVFHYFKRFAQIVEARVLGTKCISGNYGIAIVKCLKFHEAENIIKVHNLKKCEFSDLRSKERWQRWVHPDKQRSADNLKELPAYMYG